ncbi:MAG: hypothetical protein IKY79_01685 [Bacteroidales bacterium]|nr:hypothetical protein [Bacteroidales bacterium]
MGIFNFFGKKNNVKQCKQELHQKNMFSKIELEELISILSKISYIFRDSDRLVGGRNVTMMSRLHSYVGILGYFYEMEYNYGKVGNIVDNQIASHYQLVKDAMSSNSHKTRTINEVSNNWSDVLQVIFNLKLDSNKTGYQLREIEADIQKVTSAFEKLSGLKCKTPISLVNVKSKQVSYNPYNITEDASFSRGHVLPDMTGIFATELIPQIASAQLYNIEIKDIVLRYTINMIKSYYDNAGFVPMVIVDQIIGQINQVVEMAKKVSYEPHVSLKEYVLSKIYK